MKRLADRRRRCSRSSSSPRSAWIRCSGSANGRRACLSNKRHGWSWRRKRFCRVKSCCSFSAASSTIARRLAWRRRSPRRETWTIEQAPQVLIEGTPAVEARGTSTPQVTYTYETFGKPCLRLCKIADKSEAKPGEIITFTLRFDNLGEQSIGNVTIIDNLVPRLEYVAGSAQSTAQGGLQHARAAARRVARAAVGD